MTITSGFFNSVNGDRRYDAKWFALYFASFIGNGVFPNPSTGLQLVANPNMTTSVKAGKGWIDGYFVVNDGDYVLRHDNADGALKRIDRIVMRLNYTKREIEVLIKKGAFTSSPVAPTLQRDADAYELALADVLINNGVTQITQVNITDQRLNSALCGIVHGTVNQVDTTTIFNQYQAWFNDIKGSVTGELVAFQEIQEHEFLTWFESIKDILDGDVAGNLASRIASLEQGLANHIADVSHIKWIDTVGGTANALTATVPNITSYKNGLAVSFPATSNSTAAITLNINGLGAIPIKKANGTTFSNAKANGVYTVRYRAGALILQGEGGAGNAQPSDVRKGKTATVDNGDITRTLDLSQLIPGNIKNGVTIDGVTGNLIGSPTPSVGDAAVVASVGYTVQYTSDFKKIKEIICNFSGRVRITFDLYGSGTGKGYEHVYGQIYINGVPKGITRDNNSSSGTFYSEDFDINNGDRVQLYARGRTNPDTWATSDVLAICFASNPLGTVVQV